MTEGVNDQAIAKPEERSSHNQESLSDKELNFRRLEAARDREREARLRAEIQTESLKKEIESIKTMLTPKEKDPFEGIEDLADLQPSQFREILAKREAQIKKEFEQALPQKLEEYERTKRKTNFRDTLRNQYPDYDSVMNEDVISSLPEREGRIVESLSKIEDPYERCKSAYEYLKEVLPNLQAPSQSEALKKKVEENQQNPYYFDSGFGTPSPAVEFDVRSKSAKAEAYAKLKAAQRKAIQGPSMRA